MQADLDAVLRDTVDAELVEPAHDALTIAKLILHAEELEKEGSAKPADHALRWLRGLISGEIDADRCDYILRDSRNYGLIGAGFDLDRLIANLSIADVDDRNTRWETVVLAHGVSAAEEFLVARFRMYQWAIYHHKIQQAAAGLRHALRHELQHADDDVRRFLEDIERVLAYTTTDKPDRLRPATKRVASYTDGWWLEHLKRRLSDDSWCQAHQDVAAWIDLFIYRQRGPRSLWKKATDLEQQQLDDLNAAAARSVSEPDRWREAVRALQDKGVLTVVFPWTPWKVAAGSNRPESRLRVWDPADSGRRSLSSLSPLVNGLRDAWSQSVQVLTFARDRQALNDPDVHLTLRNEVVERLIATTAGSTDHDSTGKE